MVTRVVTVAVVLAPILAVLGTVLVPPAAILSILLAGRPSTRTSTCTCSRTTCTCTCTCTCTIAGARTSRGGHIVRVQLALLLLPLLRCLGSSGGRRGVRRRGSTVTGTSARSTCSTIPAAVGSGGRGSRLHLARLGSQAGHVFFKQNLGLSTAQVTVRSALA